MRYINIIILFLSFSIHVLSQEKTVNQTDAQGRKQGYWKKTNEEGKLIYEGYFKDNKPVDTLKRYFEDGSLKALMIYSEKHDTIEGVLFFENGGVSAEGKYLNKEKTGLWKYYSEYFKCLIQEETYIMGKKEGLSVNYYQNGSPSEVLQFKNDIKDGKWMQYFDNGQMKFEANYINDKLNGEYELYQPDGKLEIKGSYKDDLKDGKWSYYDEKGKLYKEIVYNSGVAENEEELREIQNKYMDLIEQNQGKYQEPDETGGY
ncbi:MAG: toxin-antitoxin system YwqK family antitoxin [Bacteroidales bacterium]|nr:toxin-antitoxin system YwqK family antitoxin [Bacteroidales bacterium]